MLAQPGLPLSLRTLPLSFPTRPGLSLSLAPLPPPWSPRSRRTAICGASAAPHVQQPAIGLGCLGERRSSSAVAFMARRATEASRAAAAAGSAAVGPAGAGVLWQ